MLSCGRFLIFSINYLFNVPMVSHTRYIGLGLQACPINHTSPDNARIYLCTDHMSVNTFPFPFIQFSKSNRYMVKTAKNLALIINNKVNRCMIICALL